MCFPEYMCPFRLQKEVEMNMKKLLTTTFITAFFILGYVWQQRLFESSLLAGNPVWILCVIIWIYCIINFVFILLDIKQLKKSNLSAAESPMLYDPLTKLPNRTA